MKSLSYRILIFSLLMYSINTIELNAQNETDYEKNLNSATNLYLSKKDIPQDILLCLVPKDNSEFELYYRTTFSDHKMANTEFFNDTTNLIFEQITIKSNNDFYLPSLKLISFADGDYAEEFIKYLELIIKIDNEKFCKSIKGKEYVRYNPIKSYSKLYNCE